MIAGFLILIIFALILAYDFYEREPQLRELVYHIVGVNKLIIQWIVFAVALPFIVLEMVIEKDWEE